MHNHTSDQTRLSKAHLPRPGRGDFESPHVEIVSPPLPFILISLVTRRISAVGYANLTSMKVGLERRELFFAMTGSQIETASSRFVIADVAPKFPIDVA